MQTRRSVVPLFVVLVTALAGCESDPPVAMVLGFGDEAPGANCALGGTRIDAGRDDDGDGVLDPDEIERTAYACDGRSGTDGKDGKDGNDVLISLTPEPPGPSCGNGGTRVDSGVDADRDGVLDPAEISSTGYLCDGADGDPPVGGFRLLAKFTGPGGPIAEIVAASPDGTRLVYTSSVEHTVGFVDLTTPAAPVSLGTVSVAATVSHGSGEPTSVVITPDGRYALVTVTDPADPVASADPGALVFIDLATRTIAGTVALGVGPDSLRLTPDGTRAVIAIEDEENPDGNGVAQARAGSVQIVTINPTTPSRSTVATIALAPTSGNMPTDPQPEYIDITPDGATAIVSLQENNLIAVIDLATATVVRYIDAGSSIHAAADLVSDGNHGLTSTGFVGQLQPDGVCLFAGGSHFLTANEGDTPNGAFGAGLFAGGRGFSVFSLAGSRVFDSGDALERYALRAGAYPEARSSNRGIEVEGCATGVFSGAEYGFLLLERGSTVAVVDLSTPSAPVIRQLLGAPLRPEGAVTIPARNLVVVGGEGSGTGGGIWIYEGVTDPADATLAPDVYEGRSDAIPFNALGALAYDAASGLLLATPDTAFGGQRLWSFWIDHSGHRMQLVGERLLRDAAGAALTGYDPEGLAINPEGGVVIASEGVAGNGGSTTCVGSSRSNRLLFFDAIGRLDPAYGGDGIVDLPCGTEPNAIDWTTVRANGFEGVAVVDGTPAAPGGLVVYVAFQRALTTEGQLTRIGAYDVDAATWRFYFYRLEPDPGARAGNTFLSELLHVGGDKFAVIERDQGWAGAAGHKTIRVFRLASGTANAIGDPVDKVVAQDLLDHPFRFDQEKVEGLALGGGALWVTNDNDGGTAANFFLRLDPAVLDVEATPIGPTPGLDEVVINEVASSPVDFVELYNGAATAIDVSGWTLTDSDPTHIYTLPPGASIPAGGRLLIDTLGFGLGSDDAVVLYTGSHELVDQHAWTTHVESASRCPDGLGPVFWAPTPPTPGTANDCTPPPVPGQDDVVINEVNSSGADFIELYNIGAAAVSLAGWKVTDNDPTHVLVLPAGTTIAPGGRLLIEGDGSPAALRLTFGLGSADSAILLTPFDVVADSHTWTAHVASASRCAEGTGAFLAPTPATPGAPNTCP
jgi:hypothetical protein